MNDKQWRTQELDGIIQHLHGDKVMGRLTGALQVVLIAMETQHGQLLKDRAKVQSARGTDPSYAPGVYG